MLSTNSTLHQGRYRILRKFWSDPSHSLYDAHDNLFGQDVVVSETLIRHTNVLTSSELEANNRRLEDRFNFLRSLSHDAIVRVRDHFSVIDRQYIVTDPPDGLGIAEITESTVRLPSENTAIRGIERLLDALSKIANVRRTISHIGVTASNLRITPENEPRLLFFDVPGEAEQYTDRQGDPLRKGFAFMPLEYIWGGLDLASQKAIANTYDDGSLDVLESPPDFRSDIFSVGSIYYFLTTGKLPLDALERSIEILDGKPDPLTPPHLLNEGISSEFSNFLMKTMRLRREDRFESFDRANRSLSAIEPVQVKHEGPAVVLFDESDLLEIPMFSPVAPVKERSNPGISAIVSDRVAPVRAALVPADFADAGPTPIAWEVEAPAQDLPKVKIAPTAFEPAYSNESLFPAAPDSEIRTVNIADLPDRPRWFMSPVTIAVAALALVGIAAFMFISINSGSSSGPVNQIEVKSSVAAQSANVAGNTDVTAATTPTDTQNPASGVAVPPESVGGQPLLNPAPAKNRPAIAEVKPKPEAKTSPAETGPKTKKKVTVDDLINDN
jgi:serine/threonine protein kinase